jgi:hypothetical protein
VVQLPQNCGLVLVLTHCWLQRVGVWPVHPLAQENVPFDPSVQTGVEPEQATPHAPQLVLVVMFVSHPASDALEQWARPARQAFPTKAQAPAMHWIPVGFTPGSVAQSKVQLPQCCGSVERLTQALPHRVSWQPASAPPPSPPPPPPSPGPPCPPSPLAMGFEPHAPRANSREAASDRTTRERLGGSMTIDYTTAVPP